jgi:hypothetical protein
MNLLTDLFARRRRRNRARNFIESSYAQHGATKHLVSVLPELAKALYCEAERAADAMLESEVRPGARRLLTECVFDLELGRAFDVVAQYTKDAGLASCFIDALVFEATRKESSVAPTETQYVAEGTQACRGIAKYSKAKHHFKRIPDATAWLFGKEYSAIMSGSAMDFAYILAAAPMTLLVRAEGGWLTRYFLTGARPTQEEREAIVRARDRLVKELHTLWKTAPE